MGVFNPTSLKYQEQKKRPATDEPRAPIINTKCWRWSPLVHYNMMILSTTIGHNVYVMKQIERYQWKLERDKETKKSWKLCIIKMNQRYKLDTNLVIT